MCMPYLEAKGYDNWSEYLRHIGIDGNIHERKRKFWAHISQTFPVRVSFRHRVIYYLATTRFGVWFIQKYLGMKGRIAA